MGRAGAVLEELRDDRMLEPGWQDRSGVLVERTKLILAMVGALKAQRMRLAADVLLQGREAARVRLQRENGHAHRRDPQVSVVAAEEAPDQAALAVVRARRDDDE